MALKNIAVSSGSACTSASLEPSYVLRAIGVEEDLAHTSMRFGARMWMRRAVFSSLLILGLVSNTNVLHNRSILLT